ncbi:hypothetical protein [Pseudomonas nitroreducens]|uniref:hypothetical protein n=1 Tax=Pseudomonas nitroreducens TaxID=46680 RepID=UPI001F54B180|nr:hypothetical protein [Pseudomonas nitroreducens]
MTDQQTCTACGVGGHTAAQCHWNAPGALESIRLPKHGTTIALDEVLAGYLPDDREDVREVIEAYADIQARKAVMLFSGASLALQPAAQCKTCNGTGMIDDGEICCSEGGTPYENGPVKCVKDCPACKGKPPKQAGGAHVPDDEFAGEFAVWWEEEGQFCRAGGGDYERTFAFQAWRHLYPQLMQTRAALAEPSLALKLERPEVVGYRSGTSGGIYSEGYGLEKPEPLMTVAQHERVDAARVTEIDELGGLVKRLGDLLSQIAIALRGPEPPLTRYGYADLPLRVKTLLCERNAAQAGQLPQPLLDVHAERRRQVEAEGFDASHDDMATKGQIARAAGCYALHAGGIGTDWPEGIRNGAALFWPWDEEWWKPKPPRENLVRAGAMIIAEIERLDRAAAPAQGGRDE